LPTGFRAVWPASFADPADFTDSGTNELQHHVDLAGTTFSYAVKHLTNGKAA
jgi:hypothetical protein